MGSRLIEFILWHDFIIYSVALLIGATSVFAQRTQVGGTLYDLQTNNSLCRRVATTPSGEIVITYHA